ncbi:glycoside hydrolase family 26 protein [Clavibacter tessellarius]|uniref:glycoside hydrolase family 26 protein n=1 Tax=Clavibacter tessellarius TaxID=31965 RepID=UPI00325413FB
MSHVDFTNPAPIAGLTSVAARGADSLLTWEPWKGGAGTSQPAYSNARIVAGDQDAYIRSWGADLAKYGKTVYLRYGHEMNGNWYPWSDGVNGNAPGSYVQAWKHVHDLVVAQGATNVKWVWSPNVPYPGSTDLASLYPGSDQVDVVALDGYNWGSAPGQRWTDPAALFGPGIDRLRAVAPAQASRHRRGGVERGRRIQGRVEPRPRRLPAGAARRARLRVVRLPEGGGLAPRQHRRLRRRPPRRPRAAARLTRCPPRAHGERMRRAQPASSPRTAGARSGRPTI